MSKQELAQKENYTVDDLLEIMEILRSKDGCVWDREQDHHSIRNNFIEETYEVVEAIDTQDPVLLQEELGDVLLQVVFHTQLEKEKQVFDFDAVCDGICKKLIYRHPHVFGDVSVKNSSQVLDNWDKLKKVEKNQSTAASTLEGVAKSLPALVRSAKVQKRAAKTGFCYPDVKAALQDLKSEIQELEQAIENHDQANIQEEMGDILFSAVNVSRFVKQDPEEALTHSTEKFIRRFTVAEQLAISNDIELSQCTIDELNDLWHSAKEKTKQIYGGTKND